MAGKWQEIGRVLLLLCKSTYGTMVMLKTVHRMKFGKKGLLQNAVFRHGKKIFALKKLAKTASQMVLANFFFGLIF